MDRFTSPTPSPSPRAHSTLSTLATLATLSIPFLQQQQQPPSPSSPHHPSDPSPTSPPTSPSPPPSPTTRQFPMTSDHPYAIPSSKGTPLDHVLTPTPKAHPSRIHIANLLCATSPSTQAPKDAPLHPTTTTSSSSSSAKSDSRLSHHHGTTADSADTRPEESLLLLQQGHQPRANHQPDLNSHHLHQQRHHPSPPQHQSQPAHLHAITEEEEDEPEDHNRSHQDYHRTLQESSQAAHLHHPHHQQSYEPQRSHGTTLYEHSNGHSHAADPSAMESNKRDSGYGQREDFSHGHNGSTRASSFSSANTTSMYPSGPPPNVPPYTSAPRSSRPASQRSVSLNMDHYGDHGHRYEQDPDQPPRRTDRSKSDYALHQQNYGPYLNASPPLSAATPFQSNTRSIPTAATSTSAALPATASSNLNASTGFHPISSAPASASLYASSESTTSSRPASAASGSGAGASSGSGPGPGSGSGAGSGSLRSLHEYGVQHSQHQYQQPQQQHQQYQQHRQHHAPPQQQHQQQALPAHHGHHRVDPGESRRAGHGPILPPPAAMLSGADIRPTPRIYGIDAAIDIRPMQPTPPRVYGIDAPAIVDPRRPPPRIYGIDAADVPPRLPPPPTVVPYTAHPYSKPHQDMSDEPPRRIVGSDSNLYQRPGPPQRQDIPQEPPRRIVGSDSNLYQRPGPPVQEVSDEPPRRIVGSDSHLYQRPGPPRQDMPQEPPRRIVGSDSNLYQRPIPPPSSAPVSNQPSYGTHSYGYSSPSNHHYSPQDMDRSRYDYEQRGWTSSQASSGPPLSSSSYSRARPSSYIRTHSPTQDIKPPTWYQNYANSVPPKQAPLYRSPTYSTADAQYYAQAGITTTGRDPNQRSHSSLHPSRAGYSGSYDSHVHHDSDTHDPSSLVSRDGEEHGSTKVSKSGKHRSSSKRSKSGLSSSQSVHPFDNTSESRKSGRSSKRDRGRDEDLFVVEDEDYTVKAKRKRANASQLSVLNAAFERSYFPSTEERLRLSKQCRMCPRTVQIWFQNKRQSVKARSDAMEAAVAGTAIAEEDEEGLDGQEGQKRSLEDRGDEPGASRHRSSGHVGSGKRRSSGPSAPSEAVMASLQIQLDGRSVDYFSRKRRATIAKMEQSEQQQQKLKQKQQLLALEQAQELAQEQVQQQQQS